MKAMCQDTTPILGCSAVYCGKHSQNRKIDSHWALKHIKGVRNGGVKVKVNPPPELDILQKLYYLRKGD